MAEFGRELYTSPFIWVNAIDTKIEKNSNGKLVCKDSFTVEKIQIKDKVITGLAIKNKDGKRVFKYFVEE